MAGPSGSRRLRSSVKARRARTGRRASGARSLATSAIRRRHRTGRRRRRPIARRNRSGARTTSTAILSRQSSARRSRSARRSSWCSCWSCCWSSCWCWALAVVRAWQRWQTWWSSWCCCPTPVGQRRVRPPASSSSPSSSLGQFSREAEALAAARCSLDIGPAHGGRPWHGSLADGGPCSGAPAAALPVSSPLVVAALVGAALRAGVLGCLLGVLVLDLGGLGHARAALALLALRHVDLDDTEHVVGDLLRRIGERIRHRQPGRTGQEADDGGGRDPRPHESAAPRFGEAAARGHAAHVRGTGLLVDRFLPHGSQPGADLVVVHTGANARRTEKVTRRLPFAATRAAARAHAPAASSPRPGACRRCGRRPSRPGRRRTAARRLRVGRR